MQNKNFNISIGSFPLQGNPKQLIPWMVYTIVFLVANTVLYIVYAAQYLAINDTANGAGHIIGIFIYFGK
jgi:hypothetical protein